MQMLLFITRTDFFANFVCMKHFTIQFCRRVSNQENTNTVKLAYSVIIINSSRPAKFVR